MSLSTRTTSKGGKAKGDTNKSHKHDKSDTGKGSGDKLQHGGSGEHVRTKNDDPGIKDKVKQVMDMTRRSEEEVCLALHDCDLDIERTINMLYETTNEAVAWETSSKKKKNRQASTSKAETEEAVPVDDWNEGTESTDKEKPRNKSGGGPPRLHGRHNDSRGWRGREAKDGERNLEDGSQSDRKERRGRGGGRGGGGGGGGSRGRGGGRAGSRYPPRNGRGSFPSSRTIDTWDNATSWESTTITNSTHQTKFGDKWDDFPQADDWSTEEYTGSLADTKVFTPSTAVPPIMESAIEAKPEATLPLDTMPSMHTGTLNAAQAQYLNQLTQQTSDNLKSAQQYGSAHLSQTYGSAASQSYNNGQAYINSSSGTQQYSSGAQPYSTSPGTNTYANASYPVSNTYGNTSETTAPAQHQPVRTKTQRARVPPPSKIPATAVEMPGELNSTIGFLDVQFGAMDFLSDSTSFDACADTKFSSSNEASVASTNQSSNTNLDITQTNQTSIDNYSTTKTNTQSSINTALSQSLSNTDSIPQTSEHLPGTYNTTPRNSTVAVNATPTATPSGLDLSKQAEPHSYSQSSAYNSYQSKTTTYQGQNYNSSNYNSTQTTSNNYVNNTQSYNNSQNTNSTYPNSYSAVSSYQGNSSAGAFPAITQANSYPSNSNQYHQQTNQSVYGTNSGLNSSSNYGTTPSANQYNSYNSSTNKLKETSYDSNATSVSSTATTLSSVNTATLTQTTSTGTKTTSTTLAKNTSNVMSNMQPAGVTPVMSTQYIMSQVPYFQQPIYSFEDMQLIHQQRLPHVPAGYYDMSYQTPTTLAGVRDGTLTNVAYSLSDGRFTRGDNTSPVPSTLSQQTNTQGHQAQPMLAQTGTAPFFYAPYSPMQTYQFGAVYPQLPNAHGSTNSLYPKPAAYGSNYDQLSQSQDYSKAGYVGNTQGQTKGTGANTSSGTSGNDLNAIYGKPHAALGKVNSYEKQGFHSGTPPPFTGPNHGIQNTALAPSGTSYGAQMFIPTMQPHQQHHSTQLIHQQLHQDSTNSSGQRSQTSSQPKSGSKQGYANSYWNQS